MLSEEQILDMIEITQFGVIHVQTRNRILRGVDEIAATYHRATFAPGDDVSVQPEKIRQIASIIWTPDVVEDYRAHANAASPAQSGGGLGLGLNLGIRL